jgi:hypothetical protein
MAGMTLPRVPPDLAGGLEQPVGAQSVGSSKPLTLLYPG